MDNQQKTDDQQKSFTREKEAASSNVDPNHPMTRSTNSMVKQGWGSRSNFQASYGLKMDPEGFEEGNRILEAFQEHDREQAEQNNRSHHSNQNTQSSNADGKDYSSYTDYSSGAYEDVYSSGTGQHGSSSGVPRNNGSSVTKQNSYSSYAARNHHYWNTEQNNRSPRH